MIAAGVGFRRGATSGDILAAVEAAALAHGVPLARIALIATLESKARAPAVVEAARCLAIGLLPASAEAITGMSSRTLTNSPRVAAAVGVASVAEAAALVAVGRNARLLGPRIATGCGTCALAEGDGPPGGPP